MAASSSGPYAGHLGPGPGPGSGPGQAQGIVPAQLDFLAIYNPSLGATDATIDDQIVYYASTAGSSSSQSCRRPRHRNHAAAAAAAAAAAEATAAASTRGDDGLSQEERNERLRQIGLVQGMVEFGRNFSGGQPVGNIDTEKSRVVLRELEPGWWILASVGLARLPLPPGKSSTSSAQTQPSDEQFEYSSRELKPAVLLLQDLLRAHSIFLLHHASSLSALFVRSQRDKFVNMMGRYWDSFVTTWDVLLHGNPARAIFGGIKMAACGELGFGVGEEDRGSAERAVLEGLVGRVEGLVDVVVGKFGEAEAEAEVASGARGKVMEKPDPEGPWLGTGKEPGAEDGAIFLGTGTLSRHSLRDVFYWMEDLYSWGENAYGVAESPMATRQKPRRRKTTAFKDLSPQIPPSVVQLRRASAETTRTVHESRKPAGSKTVVGTAGNARSPELPPVAGEAEGGGMDKFLNYLKLGYGTSWSLGGSPFSEPQGEALKEGVNTNDGATSPPPAARRPSQDDGAGHFLIGLKGAVEETERGSGQEDALAGTTGDDDEFNSRTLLRTLTVELESEGDNRLESQTMKDYGSHDTELSKGKPGGADHVIGPGNITFDSQDRNKTKKLRVVVYVTRPFIFTFLFELRTDSLAWEALYRSLHYQLAPLRKPLLASTAFRPDRPNVDGVAAAAAPGAGAGAGASAQIFDLVWDPRVLTVHSTIPNIPDPVPVASTALPWTRAEALSTHTQLLDTFAATRADLSELERTVKTSRGWWVVWHRLMTRDDSDNGGAATWREDSRREEDELGGQENDEQRQRGSDDEDREITPLGRRFVVNKEIFLVRKAGDHLAGSGAKGVGASYAMGGNGGAVGGGWADGASRLAQGIGIDTRRYIEGLLSLSS